MTVDRNPALAHRLQERALGFRGRPIHLIGENYVGEERALSEFELLLDLIEDRNSGQIRRKKVTGELDTLKAAVEGTGQGVGESRLAGAGDVLDKKMSSGQQSDQREFYRLGFPLDDSLNGVHECPDLLLQAGLFGADCHAGYDTWRGNFRSTKMQLGRPFGPHFSWLLYYVAAIIRPGWSSRRGTPSD